MRAIFTYPWKTRGSRISLIALLALELTACATRPTASVLQPNDGAGGARQLTLFAATNRIKHGQGFGSGRSRSLTFEKYVVSIPPTHRTSSIEWPKTTPDARRDFVVIERKTVDERQFMATAGRPVKDGPVGLFVHGYNYTYQEGLFRLAQIAVDAKIKGSPVLFSWPSEGTLAGYIADRDAALYSRDDLVSVISSLAAQPGGKPIILFGHSMGGFLIMEALRQLKLNGREDVLKRLAVFLAAPDIDTDVFLRQLETIGPMVAPLTLFVSKDDRALLVSSLFGSDRQRAGRLDINDPAVTQAAQKYRLRVIDITALPGPDETGHNRFANLAGLEPQFASFKSQQGASPAEVGAFVFDAAAIAVASPFRLVGKIVTVSAATPK